MAKRDDRDTRHVFCVSRMGRLYDASLKIIMQDRTILREGTVWREMTKLLTKIGRP